MVKVQDVAIYIINNLDVDNLKLQKLLYYCQGINYCLFNRPLFDENIEAWQYGPVVPVVYKRYKSKGFDTLQTGKKANLTKDDIETVDLVLDHYGSFSGVALINKTHQEAPWKNAYIPGKRNVVISKESIRDFFINNVEIENE